jgi:molybdopterin converting factor small subunit
MITIELFGVPRLRAGVGRVEVEAATLGEAHDGLGRACPSLERLFVSARRLHPAYRLSLNGERFVADPATVLAPGDALLLMAADVGG